MVAPLNVDGMVLLQHIHNDMRAGASVVNVAHDVEMVNDHSLDQVAERADKLRCPSDLDDRMDDLVVVRFLVLHLLLLRDQFLDHIGEVPRQRLSDLGSGIFGTHPLGDLHQPVQRDLVPVLNVFLFRAHDIQLFLRIVDQGCKRLLVPAAQRISELLVDLSSDGAGAVPQHMAELFIFPMYVRQKMLRPLRQIQDRL